MSEHIVSILRKLQFIVAGILLIGLVAFISITTAAIRNGTVQVGAPAQPNATFTSSGNTNAMASVFSDIGRNIGHTAIVTGRAFEYSAGTMGSAVTNTCTAIGRGIVHGIRLGGQAAGTAVKAAWSGIAAVFGGIGSGVVYVVTIPGALNGLMAPDTGARIVSALIQPSHAHDHADDVPVIDPDSPALKAAIANLSTEPQSAPGVSNEGPIWPMSGAVTTEFGVYHRPYQDTHTGIDISDGKRPGTTPIRPFRPGRVIEVVHSSRGLGNHVVVDHGSGVTSVYAHLDSTSVTAGQEVSLATTLGLEGTTGVSTGPHLHFEIRVHGQAANPRHFIPGQP